MSHPSGEPARAVAGAIVILAGAVLGLAAAVAHAVPAAHNWSDEVAILPAVAGAVIIGLGLVLLPFGWDRADRRPPPGAPRPDHRP